MEEEQVKNQDNVSQLQPQCPAAPEARKINGFPFMSVYELGVNESTPMEELTLGQGNVKHNFQANNLFNPIPFVVSDPKASIVSDNTSSSSSSIDPPTLSLGLSFSSDQRKTSSSTHLHAMPCFKNGDNIISVA